MKLSIVLPVRNESAGILGALDLIISNIAEIDYEIVIINDFSDDNSSEIVAKKIEQSNKIKLFNNNKKGLGGAINLGISKSTGEAICIMMADMADDISDLKTYYQLIQNENLDAVFGSRFIKGSSLLNYPIKKLILNRIFTYITKLIF